MMEIRTCTLLIVLTLICQPLHGVIEIRPATIDDLEKVIAMDYAVSMEFFKPMYEKCFSNTVMGQQAEKTLTNEVAADLDYFKNILQADGATANLIIAVDSDSSNCCGLIACEKVQDTTVEIELLLVAKEYRSHGIGKKLIKKALLEFGGVRRCEVYPFQAHNEPTLAFYERVGFKRIGKGPADRKNAYGLPYDQLYFEYVVDQAGIERLVKG